MDPDLVTADDTSSSASALMDPSRAILTPLATAVQPSPTPLPPPINVQPAVQPVQMASADISAPEPVNVGSPAGPVSVGGPGGPVQLAQNPNALPPPPPRGGAHREGWGQGPFGSNTVPIQPTIAPDADQLDVEIDNLRRERDQNQAWGADKDVNFWNRPAAEEARAKATALTEKLQQKLQEKQQQNTNIQMGKNWELDKVMSRTADAAAYREEAVSEWKNDGNYSAYKGLKGVGDPRADLFMSEGINAMGKQVRQASELYSRLTNAGDAKQYASERDAVLKAAQGDNALKRYGLTDGQIPKTKGEYDARRAEITGTLNDARVFVANYNQKQMQVSQQTPITDEKVAGVVTGTKAFSNGEAIPGTHAVTFDALGGVHGAQAQTGSNDLGNYGSKGPDGYSNASPAQIDTQQKQMNSEQSKGAIGQYRMAKTFFQATHTNNDMLYKSAAGVALVEDELGAIGRDVAEGSKASGSIGLVKIFDSKFGGWGSWQNKAATELSEFKTWYNNGKQGAEPRLSPQTIAGLKEVANFKLNQTEGELGRTMGIDTAARYGIPLDKLGLDGETQRLLEPTYEKALVKARLDMDKYPAIVKGDQRTFLAKDVYIPPGTPGFVPAGSYAQTLASLPVTPPTTANQPPPGGGTGGAGGSATPPSGAATPPVTKVNAPAPGGPGTSVLVNGPAGGLTPGSEYEAYARGVGTAESSGRWDAMPPRDSSGRQLSSASGYFQMIDDAWNANKPEGAPAHAYQATEQQQKIAFANYTANNAAALQKSGLPLTALNLAVTHQQGSKGGPALLKAPDDALAKDQVGKKEAANNDAFFWDKATGRPLTVAESKAKFAAFYRTNGEAVTGGGGGGARPPATAQPAAIPVAATGGARPPVAYTSGIPPDESGGRFTPEEGKRVTQTFAHTLPVAGTIGGGIAGTFVGQPVAGAMIGGASGKIAEHAMTSEDLNPSSFILPAATGAVEGGLQAVTGGISGPIVGPAVRAGTQAVIAGGETLLHGGTARQAAASAVGGALGSVGLEGFAAALGPTFSKIFRALTSSDQAAVQAAGKVLATQKPKTMLADGTTVENKAYTAAEKEVKDRGIEPEYAAHGYNEAVGKPTTAGEANVTGPGRRDQMKAAAELEDVKNQVGEAGAAAGVKPRNPVPSATITPSKGGVLEALQTPQNPAGKIGAQYRPEIEQAEQMVQTPATSMGHRFDNMAKARTTLLDHETSALRNNDIGKANAMRDAADIVRGQQEALIRRVAPPAQAQSMIDRLGAASARYRTAVIAGGKDIVATIAGGGAKGVEAKVAFDRLAANDPVAQRWMNSMVAAHGQNVGKDFLQVAATASGGLAAFPLIHPVAGVVLGVISAVKAKQAISNYMTNKAAGRMVDFRDLVMRDVEPLKQKMRQVGSSLGGAGGAGVVHQLGQPSQPAGGP